MRISLTNRPFADVINVYKQNGIRIVSIGVETLQDDETEERKRFELLKLAGAHAI